MNGNIKADLAAGIAESRRVRKIFSILVAQRSRNTFPKHIAYVRVDAVRLIRPFSRVVSDGRIIIGHGIGCAESKKNILKQTLADIQIDARAISKAISKIGGGNRFVRRQ